MVFKRKRSHRNSDLAFLVFSSVIGCFSIIGIINFFRDTKVGKQGTFLIAEALIVGFLFLFIILMTIILMIMLTRQTPTLRITQVTDHDYSIHSHLLRTATKRAQGIIEIPEEN